MNSVPLSASKKARLMAPGPVMLDLVSTALNREDEFRLCHPLTGGVILFARNFETRAQVTVLTAAIRTLRPGLLIAVDHEGGRVQRFKTDGFTHLPALKKLGTLWNQDALRATAAATAAIWFIFSRTRRRASTRALSWKGA